MVLVPAGEFLLGSPESIGLEDEHPQRRIVLDAFAIDRTEVTVAAYQACEAAKICDAPRCKKKSHEPETRADHPVVCVTWEQARRYCEWAGKRLPTEAEWEKAARGGRFPWGAAEPTCELARFSGCGEGTSPVGSANKGASPFGALDMAGNVWEWVGDWHHGDYYAIAPEKNPPGPWSGTKKVVRGGAHSYAPSSLESHGRTFDVPTNAFDHVGFRCAM
jgi:formylglycine-generating enzyme required for sulfatase activity